MYFIFFIDSLGEQHQLFFHPHSYPNLMEFIRDQGYEDWGDCRGRAWCATCHIKVNSPNILYPKDKDEQSKLNQLSNLSTGSRLACQINMDKKNHQINVEYIGDD